MKTASNYAAAAFSIIVTQRNRLSLLTAVAFLAISSFQPDARADILYRETFGTATTSGQGASQGYDWAIHNTGTAVNKSASTDTTAAINRTANGSKPGTADTLGNINAGPVIGATPGAYGA